MEFLGKNLILVIQVIRDMAFYSSCSLWLGDFVASSRLAKQALKVGKKLQTSEIKKRPIELSTGLVSYLEDWNVS